MDRVATLVTNRDGWPMMEFPQRRGPWEILARETVYRDPWLHVVCDQVIRPDGAEGTHTIVHLLPGISVLAVDDAGRAYLTEDFHYGVGRTTIEAVSGGIDAGEDPLTAARRELAEELGITADEWVDLGVCDPLSTIVVSPTQLYLARRLHFGPRNLEGTERTRVFVVPFDEAVQMVLDSRITHGPTCVLVLKARQYLKPPAFPGNRS